MGKTFFQWLDEWLNVYKRFIIKPSTFERYRYAIAVFADDDIELQQIDVAYLQGKVNNLYTLGRSYSTIRQSIVCAREALQKAVSLGLVPQSFAWYCDLVEIPRRQSKVIHGLSPFVVRRIVEACEFRSVYGVLYRFLILTGVRIGEARALRWCDVDFNHCCFSVVHTMYRNQLISAKTGQSQRILPMSTAVFKLLSQLERRSDFVFARSDGNAIDYRAALRDWHKLCDDLSIEHCGFHALRHTYASHALRCGVTPVTLAKLLGHADSSFTLRRYCEASYDDMREAVKLVQY